MFCQRDTRWAKQQLGRCSDSTIGSSGCKLSVFAELLTRYNVPFTPATLNSLLTTMRIYSGGCLLDDKDITKVSPAITCKDILDCGSVPADLSRLNKGDGIETMLRLDYDHNPNTGLQNHFVLFDGWVGTDIMIGDPLFGDIQPITKRYGNDPKTTITKIVRYNVPIKVIQRFDIVKIGEQTIILPTSLEIKDDYTVGPLRPILTALGYTINWDNGILTIK